jgi:hypothetical protein
MSSSEDESSSYAEHYRHFQPHLTISSKGLKVKSHLRPFYPYVEKLSPVDGYHALPSEQRQAVNVALLRLWIQACEKSHGNHCFNEVRSAGRPLLLIDVEEECIVPAENQIYVALSYVWGNAICTSLTKANEAFLRVKGSVSSSKVSIPRTIRQAMELVRDLNQRYLWVDRLCIVQDDERAKKDQIKSMAEIYSNSYLTIIAARGRDATWCLWGESGKCERELDLVPIGDGQVHELRDDGGEVTSPSSPSSKSFSKSMTHDDVMHGLAISLVRSKWWRRGWTFQEWLFSRRKLVFNGNTVTWECHCAAWHGNQRFISTRPCALRGGPISTGFRLPSWPNFYRFARLVCLFGVREFTYPEDVLDAFEGALSSLSSVFDGGFITGLPQMVFDAALLWQPYFPMERRKARSRQDSILPSWSWAGWKGSIHSEDWIVGCNYVCDSEDDLYRPGTCTISTVKWSHSNAVGETSSQSVVVSAANYMNSCGDDNQVLPDGWSRSASYSLPPSFPGAKARKMPDQFQHTSNPSQSFWYPVPIRDPNLPPTPPLRSAYLHGRTRTAHLELTKTYPQRQTRVDRCADALLNTTEGRWAGYIRLNEEIGKMLVETKWPCEVIELSRGSTMFADGFHERYAELSYPQCYSLRHTVYEFYNVMWIGWDSGVAYRKGVGRVERSIWESIATEYIDVTIG